MDDVDLAVLQQPGGAGGVDDLGERLAEPVAWRDGVGGQERRRGQGPTGADQGDLVATVDQALGRLGALLITIIVVAIALAQKLGANKLSLKGDAKVPAGGAV